MRDHKLTTGRGRWVGSWGCSCGAAEYHTRTRASAKDAHADHVERMRAQATLSDALRRWDGDPAQLFLDVGNLCDWAERDQDECRQCGDEAGEREAKNNLRIVAELRRALPALLIRDGWKPGRT